VTGYKVVWQGQIYQSSWYNQGTAPGSAGGDAPTGPWQALGPVPAGSHPPATVPLTTGHYPIWSASKIYHAGDRVRFGGLPYEARFYTAGQQPLPALPADPSAAWTPLFKYAGEPTTTTATAAN
jgi:chitinase